MWGGLPAALDVRGVDVRYGDVTALDTATLRLEQGRVCGLVGTNGAGKSTLLKAALGLVRPSAGTVRLLGRSPAQARSDRLVSYVPQAEDVDWSFPVSVRDVVTTGRQAHMGLLRRPGRADRESVADALDRVGLLDLADRQVGRLSGGQRKRVFVARGIAQDASLLLLDEPFAGVDRASQDTVSALLRELAREGRTILVSTHDLAALPSLCDEAVLLARRVLAHGPVADVLRPDVLAGALGLPSPLEVR